jgi:hypothetical protein
MDIFQTLIKSRRFWVAVAGIAIAVGRDSIPFLQNFTDEQITQAIMVLGAWIVGESLRSSEAVKQDAS